MFVWHSSQIKRVISIIGFRKIDDSKCVVVPGCLLFLSLFMIGSVCNPFDFTTLYLEAIVFGIPLPPTIATLPVTVGVDFRGAVGAAVYISPYITSHKNWE